MVEAMDEDEDDAGEQPVSATMTFFRVVQFLYFAARERSNAGYHLNMLTTSHPQDRASLEATKHGIGSTRTRDSPTSVSEVAMNLGATLEHFTS
jgi:phenylpropionate dioxygenase-like ring-hydroxylating dioxygenase large terminal subunit